VTSRNNVCFNPNHAQAKTSGISRLVGDRGKSAAGQKLALLRKPTYRFDASGFDHQAVDANVALTSLCGLE
jgi:hypothetical protein